METPTDLSSTHNHTSATDTRTKNLNCWRTDTSPQCLRIDTGKEVYLFPYGYFQYARFSQQGGKDMVLIQFLDQIVMVKGAGLASLCDALARFAVTNLWERPEKYTGLRKNEGIIENIEIKQIKKQKTETDV